MISLQDKTKGTAGQELHEKTVRDNETLENRGDRNTTGKYRWWDTDLAMNKRKTVYFDCLVSNSSNAMQMKSGH